MEYLLVNSIVKVGCFYFLLKLYKKGCLGRLVIFGCNIFIEKISVFVDYYLKLLVILVSLYIKDINDFLRKFIDIGIILKEVILVIIDVVGLYFYIFYDEGFGKGREGKGSVE